MIFYNNKIEESFESKKNGIVVFASGEHPVCLFFRGDYDIRANMIFNHPDVEGFVYCYEGTLTKDFLATRIIDFKNLQGNQVVAVNGNFSECVPFIMIEFFYSATLFIIIM